MLGWKPLLVSWLNTLPKTLNEENRELIKDLFDRMEEALLQFIRKGGFKVEENSSVKSFNALSPNVKIQIPTCCPYTFPVKVVVRSCCCCCFIKH